jgi:hypothetical protein
MQQRGSEADKKCVCIAGLMETSIAVVSFHILEILAAWQVYLTKLSRTAKCLNLK